MSRLKTAGAARTYRRTLVSPVPERGRTAADIAERRGVTRQGVHIRAADFALDPDPSTLDDEERTGRAPVLAGRSESVLRPLMPRAPQDHCFPDRDRTVQLLRRELEGGASLRPSDETVRRGLHRLKHAWKRSRYVPYPAPEREKKTPDSASD
jgi:hypothetical protein